MSSDFTDLFDTLNIPYQTEGHHHCRTGWVQFDCPFCGEGTRKWHMGFSLSSGYVNCWRCGHKGLTETLCLLTHWTPTQVRAWLRSNRIVHKAPHRLERRGTLKTPGGVGPLAGAHKRYLKDRGLDPDEIERLWNVQGIGLSSSLAWRLFIPVYQDDDVVSWTTRSIARQAGGGPRYISAKPEDESVPLKHVLYGEQYARQAIIICEGPTDVWRIGPGAVATFGVNYSSYQFNRMTAYPVRVVCFDTDKSGRKCSTKLANDLSVFPGETFNVSLETGDAGSASPSAVKRLRKMFLDN